MHKLRCGFVAIVGRPNMGKSTLLNAMLGEKVAIATSKPQTTRHRIRGVLTLPERGQLVFLDTPGFSKPLDSLGTFMSQEGHRALADADAVLMVVDASQPAGKGDAWLAEQVLATQKPVLLVFNKIDQVPDATIREQYKDSYLACFPTPEAVDCLTISALTGKRVGEIPKWLLRHMPHADLIYDPEAFTDQHVRDMAQELIREKAMQLTHDEIPHRVAVLVERFDESDPTCTHIDATLYVDQTSQKGILIGKKGEMIQKIGREARLDIERLLGTPVYLALHVKVKPHWRKDPAFLKLLGVVPCP